MATDIANRNNCLLTFKMSVVTNDNGSIIGLTEVGNAIYMSGLKWLVMLAPLGIVFIWVLGLIRWAHQKLKQPFGFFALMGLSLSSILLVYTGLSVTRVSLFVLQHLELWVFMVIQLREFDKIWFIFNDGFNWNYYCIFS